MNFADTTIKKLRFNHFNHLGGAIRGNKDKVDVFFLSLFF